MGKPRFVRIHGRIVPLRSPAGAPASAAHVAAIRDAAVTGTVAGGAVYAGAKGVQHTMFKRGFRLQGVADFYRNWKAPTLNATQTVSGKGFKMLKPDMFQQHQYNRAYGVYERMVARAPKWQALADKSKLVARKLGKYALPAAIVGGIAAGAVTYFANRPKGRK